MELTQGADPDQNAPDSNSGTPPRGASPDEGSSRGNRAQSPGDDNDNDNDEGSNSGSSPESAEPPGCIFRDRPLELLV